MKKLLCFMTSLLLIIAMMPEMSLKAAAEEPTHYGISLGSTVVKSTNKDDILGDGKASYDPETTTLKLNGVNINCTSSTKDTGMYIDDSFKNSDKTLIINIEGDNTITGPEANTTSGLLSYSDMKFTGTGSLKATGGKSTGDDLWSAGIDNHAAIEINGPAITAEGGDSVKRSLGIKTYDNNSLTVTSGSLVSTYSNTSKISYGIYSTNIIINGGTVKAIGSTAAMYSSPRLSSKVALVSGDRYSAYNRWVIYGPKLGTSSNLKWESKKATWDAAENASSYSVQLYKDGVAEGNSISTTETSKDFTSEMTSTGSYTFKVTAIGDGTNNVNGDQSEESPAYVLYGIWFTGIQLTTDNISNVIGGGKVSFDPDTTTLNLNGAMMRNCNTYNNAALYIDDSFKKQNKALTINATDVSFLDPREQSVVYGIITKSDIKFTGSGEFTVDMYFSGDDLIGIMGDNNNIEFDGPKFTAQLPRKVQNSSIAINNCHVTVNSGHVGLFTGASDNISYGMGEGSITINGGTVWAESKGTTQNSKTFLAEPILGSGITNIYGGRYDSNNSTIQYGIKLATPTNLAWTGKTATWTACPNALKYYVDIYYAEGGLSWSKSVSGDKNSIDLTDDVGKYGWGSYTITVKAEGDYGRTLYDSDKSAESEPYTDTVAPTGKITIKNNSWSDFRNNAIFGLFFKNTKEVEINASDNESGIAQNGIKYYISNKALTLYEVKNLNDSDFFTYNDELRPQLIKNSKYVVYAKLTDNCGNTSYISSDGAVIYSDSSVNVSDATFDKYSNVNNLSDVTIGVTLNGNIVKSIKNGSDELIKNTDYTVSGESIILKKEYLNTLSKGSYNFAVSFNPQGETYVDIDDNDAPNDSTFNLDVVEKYVITYSLDGGTNESNAPTNYTFGTGVSTLPTPTKDNYDFEGWYIGTTNVTSITATDSGDKELKAKWKANKYTLTLNCDGGHLDTPLTEYTYGDTITLPKPTKTGYTFDGWYIGTTNVTGITATDLGDKELKAKWKANKYALTLNCNGGHLDTPLTEYTYGDTITLPTPAKTGYTFDGWYDGDTEVTSITATDTGAKDLTAIWTENPGENTTDIVAPAGVQVGSFDDLFNNDKLVTEDKKGVTSADLGNNQSVNITITVTDKTKDNAQNAQDIITSSNGKKIGLFFDISVLKNVTKNDVALSSTKLIELPELITINIPLSEELQGKESYSIFRYHEENVDEITSTPNADGENVKLASDGKALQLQVKKFSTYAIGYTEKAVTGGNNGNTGTTETPTVPSNPSTSEKTDDTANTSIDKIASNPKTGSNIPVSLMILSGLSIAGYVFTKKKNK